MFVVTHISFCSEAKENCIGNFYIERIYDAPAPDNIGFSSKLSKEYERKIADTAFCHINFYINEKEQFTTHDVSIDVIKDSCFFRMRTTHFLSNESRITESEFYKLMDSSIIRLEFVYDDSGDIFFFSNCK